MGGGKKKNRGNRQKLNEGQEEKKEDTAKEETAAPSSVSGASSSKESSGPTVEESFPALGAPSKTKQKQESFPPLGGGPSPKPSTAEASFPALGKPAGGLKPSPPAGQNAPKTKQASLAAETAPQPKEVKPAVAAPPPSQSSPTKEAPRSSSSMSSSSSVSSASESLNRMSVGPTYSQMLPPQKRNTRHFPGVEGRRCRLQANHFQIRTKIPKGTIYMYSLVVATPWSREYRRSDRDLYQRIIEKWKKMCEFTKKNPYSWVYDGNMSMYSTNNVKGTNGHQWKVMIDDNMDDPDKLSEFIIKDFKLVNEIAVDHELAEWANKGQSGSVPQDAIHLLDVLLSQAVNLNLSYTSIGRSYYLPTKGHVLDIGFGKEVWTGLFSSVRPYGWKDGGVLLTLNVDVSNKPATKELHLTDDVGGKKSYIYQVLTGKRGSRPPDFRNGLDPRESEALEKDLKGMKVRYSLPNGSKRGYRVNSLKGPADTLKIPDLGKSVAQYFQETYQKKLRYPKMPCLWLGSREKTIYIPVEMCSMEAQALPRNKALQDDATATMIRGTAVNPLERQKKILEGLKANNDYFRNDPFTKAFGINVAGQMSEINGRILDPPVIEYRANKKINIDQGRPGSWMQRNVQYVDGKKLNYWAVIDMSRMRDQEYSRMIQELVKVGSQNGLAISAQHDNMMRVQESSDAKLGEAFQYIVDEYKKINMKLEMILVVLPHKDGHTYDKVKKLGDMTYKVPTQCVIKKNVFKPDGSVNFQVLGNLCLKINSKLGGINHVLATSKRPALLNVPTMVMGADVTHPAPEHKGQKPSIAAIVGSIDPKASLYEVQVRIQSTEQNEEVIQEMKEVTKLLLRKFKEHTKQIPQRIVMYRDGVSEGQFLTVLAQELLAMRQACKELNPNYKPMITYLVVQKRHHTRFFPMDNNKYRNNNALAGTVVDQGINHPTEGDFYLLSHEGIQGTSRPCHYQVLWDDANMTADELETLSYYLCHLYARCTRSVSYPTPTYYSHLAADRARKHHNELIIGRETPERAKTTIEGASYPLMYFV